MLYLLLINVLTFLVFGWDKRKAKRPGARRVPEKTLFLLAGLGGSPGAWLGMRVWHHKTLHRSFRIGIPLIFLLQLAAVAALLRLMFLHPDYPLSRIVGLLT